ncbi:MAG: EVE domain-containing protein, partial [Gammaproteobacteria bacterium]|nr:EVE domain-containing protein [Gammaproteobacteria bacterium]
MNYWLMKSEPSAFSVDDLEQRPGRTEHWDGVRNYQARNMLRDQMRVGDLAFFYHSSCERPGIAGITKIVRAGYPD